MTMFYVVKAGTLHCDNTVGYKSNGCIFCEYHSFCEKVVSAIKCLQTEFPNDYERIYGIITESKGVTNDPTNRN